MSSHANVIFHPPPSPFTSQQRTNDGDTMFLYVGIVLGIALLCLLFVVACKMWHVKTTTQIGIYRVSVIAMLEYRARFGFDLTSTEQTYSENSENSESSDTWTSVPLAAVT